MYAEYEEKIYALLENDSLADQVLEIVRADAAAHRAELVRRQNEGLKRAKERGVRLGRPPAVRPKKFQSIYALYTGGEISARAASKALGVSAGTFRRWAQDMSEDEKDR